MDNFTRWWEKCCGEYDALLFDIDGTLISAGECLPGADRLLARLREIRYPFYLLTNDGNHSTEEKSVLLAKAGLHVAPDEIVSCAMALRQFAADTGCWGQRFFIMGDLGVPCFAERAGLEPCRDVEVIDSCAGVIVGEGFYNWHDHIQAVFNYLVRHPDRPLLVPNPDSYWPGRKKGEFGIGAGAKARFICEILAEMGIAVEPVYLGKPYPVVFEYAITLLRERYGLPDDLDHHRIIMVGDSMTADICGANQCGLTSVLVLTGITTAAKAEAAEAEFRPQLVFPTLG